MVINISNLPNGIYFVMITTEQGRVTKKVIKQAQ
ncbi:MAG: T9SS type A sorting domain-containing protein [Bacteroidales bacterium]|nr:T9SS type A sorting domain-containing protein [Bacteroidales bacterium]